MKILHPIYWVLLDQMIKGIRKESLGLKRVWINIALYKREYRICGYTKGIPLTNDIGKVEPAKNGNNVYLTLDKQINSFLEEAMNKAQEHYDHSVELC